MLIWDSLKYLAHQISNTFLKMINDLSFFFDFVDQAYFSESNLKFFKDETPWVVNCVKQNLARNSLL